MATTRRAILLISLLAAGCKTPPKTVTVDSTVTTYTPVVTKTNVKVTMQW